MPRTMKLASSGRGLAVLAGAAGGGEFEGADDVLGAEVAGAEAVGAADDAGNFFKGDVRNPFGPLDGLC